MPKKPPVANDRSWSAQIAEKADQVPDKLGTMAIKNVPEAT